MTASVKVQTRSRVPTYRASDRQCSPMQDEQKTCWQSGNLTQADPGTSSQQIGHRQTCWRNSSWLRLAAHRMRLMATSSAVHEACEEAALPSPPATAVTTLGLTVMELEMPRWGSAADLSHSTHWYTTGPPAREPSCHCKIRAWVSASD